MKAKSFVAHDIQDKTNTNSDIFNISGISNIAENYVYGKARNDPDSEQWICKICNKKHNEYEKSTL